MVVSWAVQKTPNVVLLTSTLSPTHSSPPRQNHYHRSHRDHHCRHDHHDWAAIKTPSYPLFSSSTKPHSLSLTRHLFSLKPNSICHSSFIITELLEAIGLKIKPSRHRFANFGFMIWIRILGFLGFFFPEVMAVIRNWEEKWLSLKSQLLCAEHV